MTPAEAQEVADIIEQVEALRIRVEALWNTRRTAA